MLKYKLTDFLHKRNCAQHCVTFPPTTAADSAGLISLIITADQVGKAATDAVISCSENTQLKKKNSCGNNSC